MTGMNSIVAVTALAAALTACGSAAFAQPSPRASQSHAMHLVKLPNGDYTVPLAELQASGTSGTVTLHPQGLRTLVTVYVLGHDKHKHNFTLRSGSDCVAASATSGVSLRPALTGVPSRTVVAMPIAALTSKNYLLDVRNATARSNFEEACAKI